MAAVDTDILGRSVHAFHHSPTGPVTAARHRRNTLVYAALCGLAAFPFVFDATPAWKAFGRGLLVPGGGFFAIGPWAVLVVPAILFLFWRAIIVWFWCGMVLAPLLVWLGSAGLAAQHCLARRFGHQQPICRR